MMKNRKKFNIRHVTNKSRNSSLYFVIKLFIFCLFLGVLFYNYGKKFMEVSMPLMYAIKPEETISIPVKETANEIEHSNNSPDTTIDEYKRPKIPEPVFELSNFAYVTLIHGVDESYKYRGFLYSAIIMKRQLEKLGSKADFVAMVGFSSNSVDKKVFKDDGNLLKKFGIKVFMLPRLLSDVDKVSFGEMALLKITPWSFLQYDRVQYFDGDIFPTKNMDDLFKLGTNSFNTGNASPVNSGWFLAIPDLDMYEYLKSKAIQRLQNPWDDIKGWNEEVPKDLKFRGPRGKPVLKWTFNGASLDQGLFTHSFVLNKGNIQLFDVKDTYIYSANYKYTKKPLQESLKCCGGQSPTNYFAHFTGASKPWLEKSIKSGDPDVRLWLDELDKLKLPVNSENIHKGSLKPPLGFWHPNK